MFFVHFSLETVCWATWGRDNVVVEDLFKMQISNQLHSGHSDLCNWLRRIDDLLGESAKMYIMLVTLGLHLSCFLIMLADICCKLVSAMIINESRDS